MNVMELNIFWIWQVYGTASRNGFQQVQVFVKRQYKEEHFSFSSSVEIVMLSLYSSFSEIIKTQNQESLSSIVRLLTGIIVFVCIGIHLMRARQALLHINNQNTMLKAPSTPVG